MSMSTGFRRIGRKRLEGPFLVRLRLRLRLGKRIDVGACLQMSIHYPSDQGCTSLTISFNVKWASRCHAENSEGIAEHDGRTDPAFGLDVLGREDS